MKRRSRKIRFQRSAGGFSMIEFAIVAGVLSVFALVFATVLQNFYGGSARMMNGSQIYELQDMISRRLSCSETMAACAGGASGFVAVKDKKGRTLIQGSADGTKLGAWIVHARCESGGLLFEAGAIDKTTGEMRWRQMYEAGSEPCGANEGAGATFIPCEDGKLPTGIDVNGNVSCEAMTFKIWDFVDGYCGELSGLSGITIGTGVGIRCAAQFPPPPPPPKRCCIIDYKVQQCSN